ncbi:hypothetical protein [Streptomyces varsoviensis]|uniref:Transcriptional regulator n=1 Tax=Streptomyces varsoviensis TaxID=67373 RepID=A0ABR5IVK4_9ACTN|nr:hypothetical protein [Streptomyces varsoviensis]KOG85175.1 hypothetical protein ADK38_38145 [Streptomyces varsoviensis]
MTTALTSETESVRAAAERLVTAMRYVATDNAYIAKARAGRLTDDDIAALVRLENATLDNVTGCIALAAGRFPNTPAMDFLLDLGQMVSTDRRNIRAGAAAYGTALEEIPGQRLESVAYGYMGFINWLCLNADPAAIALVAHADVALWHEACVILTPALQKHAGLPTEVVDYFAGYQERPTEVLDQALEIVAGEVAEGRQDLQQTVGTARLMEDHLAAFWRAADQ